MVTQIKATLLPDHDYWQVGRGRLAGSSTAGNHSIIRVQLQRYEYLKNIANQCVGMFVRPQENWDGGLLAT